MQNFMEAIVRMGIFMICAQMLIHFRPNGSYEKYMKLLVSVMILVQIFFPVINLFLGQEQDISQRVAWFEEKIEESRKVSLEKASKAEGTLNRMAIGELQKQLEASEGESTSEGVTEHNSIEKIKIEIGG